MFELDLSGNRLRGFPGAVANMSGLMVLRLYDNVIRSVPLGAVPSSVTTLDLSDNALQVRTRCGVRRLQ